MKYLIMDDSEYKRNRIFDYIKSVDNEAEILTFTYRNSLLIFLKEFRDECPEDFMLFLDWNFPIYEDSSPKQGEGAVILAHLERWELRIPTVIVSSDDVELNEEYSFVLGFIKDNSSVYQLPEYEKYIGSVKNEKKCYRYFHRDCGETTVGIVFATNKDEAVKILANKYDESFMEDVEVSSISFDKDGSCELYYGG